MEVLRARVCRWEPRGIDSLAVAPCAASTGTFSDSQPRLAVGRSNGTVELWDTRSWHLCATSPGNSKRSVRCFVWVPGRVDEDSGETLPCRLFSSGLHREITEWNLETMEPLRSTLSTGGAVWSLCHWDGHLIAACEDGTLRIFAVTELGEELLYRRRLNASQTRVLSAAVLGNSIFVGGSDSQITKWSLASGGGCDGRMKVEKADEKTETLIWCLVALGDRGIASGDSLGLVHIWDPVTCVVLHRFAKHQADVLTLCAPANGTMLVAAGMDARIVTFVQQQHGEEAWVFHGVSGKHTHDIRAITYLEGANNNGRGDGHVSGGVAGDIMVFATGLEKQRREKADSDFALVHGPKPAPVHIIGQYGGLNVGGCFSPALQRASVAEDSRLVLCQNERHLEFWYLKAPKESLNRSGKLVPVDPGIIAVGEGSLPDAQLTVKVTLAGSDVEGQHITCSAIAPNGHRFAASDLNGTRLFNLDLVELAVQQEKATPEEVRKTAARAMLFCGDGLLAMSSWRSHKIFVLGSKRANIAARFEEHCHAVHLLAGAREWLASADTSGVVEVFNLDSLQHHARLPTGSGEHGFATALGFNSRGDRLVTVLSSHVVLVFDVESSSLVEGLPTLQRIPPRVMPLHERVCGVAQPALKPNKVLLWGHSHLVALDLDRWAAEGALCFKSRTGEAEEGEAIEEAPKKKQRKNGSINQHAVEDGAKASPPQCRFLQGPGGTVLGPWMKYEKAPHVLEFVLLDEARWGPPVLGDHCLERPAPKRSKDDDEEHFLQMGVGAMALSLEVTPAALQSALPVVFQRKQFKQKEMTEARGDLDEPDIFLKKSGKSGGALAPTGGARQAVRSV